MAQRYWDESASSTNYFRHTQVSFPKLFTLAAMNQKQAKMCVTIIAETKPWIARLIAAFILNLRVNLAMYLFFRANLMTRKSLKIFIIL
jgi:hypothetical protein